MAEDLNSGYRETNYLFALTAESLKILSGPSWGRVYSPFTVPATAAFSYPMIKFFSVVFYEFSCVKVSNNKAYKALESSLTSLIPDLSDSWPFLGHFS